MDDGRRRRLIIILAVVFVVIAAGRIAKAVGDNRVDQQTADLTRDVRADLDALDLQKVKQDALLAGVAGWADPGSGVHATQVGTYFPRSADRLVTYQQSSQTSTFWFEVSALMSTRCVQIDLHDGTSTIDVFTPSPRRCAPGPG
jgi:hypothetical protein